jgi:hypothetical protein
VLPLYTLFETLEYLKIAEEERKELLLYFGDHMKEHIAKLDKDNVELTDFTPFEWTKDGIQLVLETQFFHGLIRLHTLELIPALANSNFYKKLSGGKSIHISSSPL